MTKSESARSLEASEADELLVVHERRSRRVFYCSFADSIRLRTPGAHLSRQAPRVQDLHNLLRRFGVFARRPDERTGWRTISRCRRRRAALWCAICNARLMRADTKSIGKSGGGSLVAGARASCMKISAPATRTRMAAVCWAECRNADDDEASECTTPKVQTGRSRALNLISQWRRARAA